MRKGQSLFILLMIIICLSQFGCDPALHLNITAKSVGYKKIEKYTRWRGGISIDTMGFKASIVSLLWSATEQKPTTDFVVGWEIISERDFIFPVIKSILIDAKGKTRNAIVYPEDIEDERNVFIKNKKHSMGIRFDDSTFVEFPAILSLPKIVFVETKDTLNLGELVIER